MLPDGSVGNVQVTKSLDSNFGLDREAIRTVKQWRWSLCNFTGADCGTSHILPPLVLGGSNILIVASTSCGSTGFVRNASHLAASASARSVAYTQAEITITGTAGPGRALMRRMSSNPSTCGICKSTSTTSGRCLTTADIAFRESPSAWTSYPNPRRYSAYASRLSSSSSTSRHLCTLRKFARGAVLAESCKSLTGMDSRLRQPCKYVRRCMRRSQPDSRVVPVTRAWQGLPNRANCQRP